jgi:hypothetical protein
MFKKIFGRNIASVPKDSTPNHIRDTGTLRKALSDWRFGNDVAAIVAVLDRLPNHRLHLIGLHREGLVDSVCDMMLRAEEDREIGREVVAILDTPADSGFSGDDTTPAKK